jgi:hypothetical protein
LASGTKYKGYGLIGQQRWVEAHSTPEELAQIKAGLPADFREAFDQVRPEVFYPIGWLNSLYVQTFAVKGLVTEPEREALVFEMSESAGRENLNSVLKLLIRFLKPATLLKKVSQFWPMYFHDCPTPEVTLHPDGHHASATVRGLTDMPYINQNLRSFIMLIFAAVGAQAEVTYSRQGDDHRWEVTWA